jgi:hypothetical protein
MAFPPALTQLGAYRVTSKVFVDIVSTLLKLLGRDLGSIGGWLGLGRGNSNLITFRLEGQREQDSGL